MWKQLSEVCEPDFWAGFMNLLTLSTDDSCIQLVSIVRSSSREKSWNIWCVDTTQWGVWTCLLSRSYEMLVIKTWCVWPTGEYGEVCEPNFEQGIWYTDIINIIWLLTISEYSEKKSLEEHQKKLDCLKQCCEACEPCIQSIRENFFSEFIW